MLQEIDFVEHTGSHRKGGEDIFGRSCRFHDSPSAIGTSGLRAVDGVFSRYNRNGTSDGTKA